MNKSSGVGTLKYTWDFGDSTTSASANPTHIFTTSGSYSVSLIVNNEAGCSDTLLKPKLINVGSTVADFEVPKLVCAETPVAINNTSKPWRHRLQPGILAMARFQIPSMSLKYLNFPGIM